jgi:hypothetical protein
MANIKHNKVTTVQTFSCNDEEQILPVKLPATGKPHLVCARYYQPVTRLLKASSCDVLNLD